MISHHCGIRFELTDIFYRRFEELINFILSHLKRIQKLIMCADHSPSEEVCLLLVLYDTEHRVCALEPVSKPSELQIFNATWRRDQLDILNLLSERESVNLIKLRNSVIGKELLDIRIETTALEEAITQKQHPVLAVISKQTHVHQGLPIPNRVGDFHTFRFRD